MAHGENANKHWGREYWSPRLRFASGWGKILKRFTHEKERMEKKNIIRKEMKSLDEDK
jgi:hypothetical protein